VDAAAAAPATVSEIREAEHHDGVQNCPSVALQLQSVPSQGISCWLRWPPHQRSYKRRRACHGSSCCMCKSIAYSVWRALYVPASALPAAAVQPPLHLAWQTAPTAAALVHHQHQLQQQARQHLWLACHSSERREVRACWPKAQHTVMPYQCRALPV
jgi:hypothetical protein